MAAPGATSGSTPGGASNKAAIQLSWVYGFNKDILDGVNVLRNKKLNSLFYVSGHTGVLYNMDDNTQVLLQGHCNAITCLCVSSDGKWAVTSDSGADAMLIVWDVLHGLPVRNFFHSDIGTIASIALSPDARTLATLSAEIPQRLCLWDWSEPELTAPFLTANVPTEDLQFCMRFHPDRDTPQLVTNGDARTLFWHWSDGKLHFYAPALHATEFKSVIGSFTQSCFLGAQQALTATMDGDVILWDVGLAAEGFKPTDKKAVKAIRLHPGSPINVLHATRRYIVTGSEDGIVRVHDVHFRLCAWFEDINAGPITSISFVDDPDANYDPDAQEKLGDDLAFSDLIIGSATGLVVHVASSQFTAASHTAVRVLIEGQDLPIKCVATHPMRDRVLLAGHSGLVQIFDYSERALVCSRLFDAAKFECAAFDPSGGIVALGCEDGSVIAVHADTLETTSGGHFKSSKDTILFVAFSANGQYMATADRDNCVAVFRRAATSGAPGPLSFAALSSGTGTGTGSALGSHELGVSPGAAAAAASAASATAAAAAAAATGMPVLVYIGRYRAHYKPIVGLAFGVGEDDYPRLVSLGQDRHVVEYDLRGSTLSGGVAVKSATKIEETSVPTALWWHHDNVFVVADNEYKFKLYTTTKPMCRQTLLAPTFGLPVSGLVAVPNGSHPVPWYAVYKTDSRIMGLIKLPLDGNPHKAMALIAHPREISALAVSHDGKQLFSCGDLTCNSWRIEPSALEVAAALGGDGVDPFAALIEGGKNGAFYDECKDYFYYAQLLTQGENTSEPRKITDSISVARLPDVMRALGVYLTEHQIENLVNEVRFSQWELTQRTVEELDFDTLIRLYVNHRPVRPVSADDIRHAFELLGSEEVTHLLARDRLFSLLQTRGEVMAEEEMFGCLVELLGPDVDLGAVIGNQLNPHQFAEDILGFPPQAAKDEPEPSDAAGRPSGHAKGTATVSFADGPDERGSAADAADA